MCNSALEPFFKPPLVISNGQGQKGGQGLRVFGGWVVQPPPGLEDSSTSLQFTPMHHAMEIRGGTSGPTPLSHPACNSDQTYSILPGKKQRRVDKSPRSQGGPQTINNMYDTLQ